MSNYQTGVTNLGIDLIDNKNEPLVKSQIKLSRNMQLISDLLETKQNNLNSSNIKTINNINLVGKGNISGVELIKHNTSVGNYVLEENRNAILANPVEFQSLTIGSNSTLKLIS